jgi:pyruvate,water dikinase
VRRPGDRSLTRSGAALFTLATRTWRQPPPDLDAERAEVVARRAALAADPTDDQIADLARDQTDRAVPLLDSLLQTGVRAGFPLAALERIGRRAEEDEPGLLVKALSGLGTIETAAPARDLWALGRQVAVDPELTAAFDHGIPGLAGRLQALDEPAGVSFLEAFGAFLAAHGHRGPNEVELASDTWATAPETALAVVERLRFAPAQSDPGAATDRLADERREAARRLRQHVARPLRPMVGRLLDRAAAGAARREQAKGTLVLDLDGLRRALHGVAARLIERGEIVDRLSLFMVTVDELGDFLRSPDQFAAAIADRRRQYDLLNSLVPPYWFEGSIPDPSAWSAPPPEGSTAAGDVLTGIGVASGTARGRARIVTDPGDPRGIEAGEVLLAPITDPAWTPLFLAASAVVVEVGALQSHAAIVARELGIPAVVSVAGATSRIRDGSVVTVDGDRGTVAVEAG